MQRVKVASTSILELGFEDGVLEVVYRGTGSEGIVYRTEQFPQEEFDKLMRAESKGKTLREMLATGGYTTVKITPVKGLKKELRVFGPVYQVLAEARRYGRNRQCGARYAVWHIGRTVPGIGRKAGQVGLKLLNDTAGPGVTPDWTHLDLAMETALKAKL